MFFVGGFLVLLVSVLRSFSFPPLLPASIFFPPVPWSSFRLRGPSLGWFAQHGLLLPSFQVSRRLLCQSARGGRALAAAG